MAAPIEAEALVSGGRAADQEQLGAALVAALELALLAAHRLLGGLDSAAGRHAEAAAHLERALAFAASCAAPDERAGALLVLAAPPTASSASAACAPPSEGRAEAEPAPDHAGLLKARGAPSACASPVYLPGLTRREAEVLRLIAAGRSNREIAAALYLSPRTVERHVANVYLKIGAHSKAAAAAYALRHRLA